MPKMTEPVMPVNGKSFWSPHPKNVVVQRLGRIEHAVPKMIEAFCEHKCLCDYNISNCKNCQLRKAASIIRGEDDAAAISPEVRPPGE